MMELCIFGIILGLALASAGIIILYYTVKHIFKINLTNKGKYLIIFLHYLCLILGAWFAINGFELIIFMSELIHTILTI